MSSVQLQKLTEAIRSGNRSPVYLIGGDLVLSEAAGRQIADALSEVLDCSVESARRPASLSPVLDDLRTYSLFDSGKVRLVVESALLADRNAAAALIDAAGEVLPVGEGSELTGRQRQGATSLLQAVRVFGVDPERGTPTEVLDALPSWAFQGGPAERKKRKGRGRGKRQVADLRSGLEELLAAAIDAGMVGWAEGDLAVLTEVIRDGLPDGHHLVLVESTVSAEHPLAAELGGRGALVHLGGVSIDRRGGLEGLEELTDALRAETGVDMRPDAARELAQRTLRRRRSRGPGGGEVDPESTGRFAAEYRKLATLAADRVIDYELVRSTVEDRGEEDVFQLLDAVSAGDVAGALQRLERHLQGAEDPSAATFGFFALLASYGQQISVVRGKLEQMGARRVERNYRSFQSSGLAERLQGDLIEGVGSPLAGMHPFRLHKVYLAAVRWSSLAAKRLPSQILEAETRLKGESSSAETVLTELVVRLALASVRAKRPAQRRR